jgi:DMSO/TMAO reductase YedYZ molybdopterin-dependent catalytic subunit
MPWGYEAVGTAEWTGTPLAPLIARAKPASDVVEFAFFGADRGFDNGVLHDFGRSLMVQQLADLEALVVYEMNGLPLLPQHGAPLRLIVPGWYGMASVKWLSRIEALTEPFQGFQQVRTYRYRQDWDEFGDPVTSIRVKSLMMPPGVPDWSSRTRYLEPGPVKIQGRAWSGDGVPIAKVEFGAGDTWVDAELSDRPGRYAWTHWETEWHAETGQYLLKCRATDANGKTQPLDPPWDVAGFGNNSVQSVPVLVKAL